MTIHLPDDLERYVQSQVQCGRFASQDEAITEAVRLLRQRSQQPESSKGLTEEEWERRLLNAGLLTSLPPQRATVNPRREFQPIKIEGEPLSETVIRERR
jgi:putative addiction module CopG family antidote